MNYFSDPLILMVLLLQLNSDDTFFEEKFEGVSVQLHVCDALIMATIQTKISRNYCESFLFALSLILMMSMLCSLDLLGHAVRLGIGRLGSTVGG